MRWIRESWRRLRSLARADELEQGLDEEIRFHLERQIEKHLRAGMAPEEARRQAYLKFGGVDGAKEGTRDEIRPVLLQDSLRDLRHGMRALRRAPGFTVVAVLTLAIGIGATTAVFTVVKGVVINPLPYPDADRLIVVQHWANGMNTKIPFTMSGAMLSTYTDENRTFEQLGVWSRGTASLSGGDAPEEVENLRVSQGTLPALGAQPALGRWFATDDHTLGAPGTAILLDGYWRRRYGADSSIVGRQVHIDSRPHTIVGVMPETFRFLNETPEIILPLRFEQSELTLGRTNHYGVARLKPGVTLEQAAADIARMVPIYLQSWPSFPGVDRSVFVRSHPVPALVPLKDSVVGDAGRMLWVLMGTIGIVLLIACANVANLVLVRAEGRQHEMALRAALGARRWRIGRELLLENLILGLAGGAMGVALAFAGLRLLMTLAPRSIPRLQEVTLDPAVLGFALLLSLLSAAVFGCIPIVRHAGVHLGLALRGTGRSASESRERHRTRNVLVVVQVALAMILLIASGLMIRTFAALRAVPPGFTEPRHVQLARLSIPPDEVADPDQVLAMQLAIRERIAAIPGVTEVSFAGREPMSKAPGRSMIAVEGRPDTDEEVSGTQPIRWFRYVGPGFFRAVGTPIVAGREVTESDMLERRPVVVISENLAREVWKDPRAAVGHRIRETSESPWREIVGVVGDVYDLGVHQPAPPIVYWPTLMAEFYGNAVNLQRAVTFAIRSPRAGDEGLLNEIRVAVQTVNPNLPLARASTLRDVYDRSMASTSFTLVMLAIAGGMALVLGVIGIYGVIAYTVSQRTREIGIRAALGASRRGLEGMFVRHGVALALVGVIAGGAGAVALTRLMASLLFGTSPHDPAIYGAVSIGLVGIAALASYLPARGAARVDPVQTLRGE
jgi:predicted permease